MQHQTALLIGRFQPFHYGHLYLLKKTLSVTDRIIIGIGSANVTDGNNPYSFVLRQKMINTVIKQEGFTKAVIQIVGLDDFPDDQQWLQQLLKNVKSFDVVVGNNEWTNSILAGAGYPIMRIGYYQRYRYEGVKIRRLMQEGKNWQDRIPAYLIPLLVN
ncbi:adenylyltransferase/cytidyltransferase family protein [Patescibacteria group bacterium]|nr:adenylyltransferase/cytidyltransferase family protein [Patescibacteria group bacterium]MCL5091587.1 adenylyltransferase/cytidyltransferase family protein [Patescibacteria group bacterium]